MKKWLIVLLLVLGAVSVFAGGDQNRGDKGKGAVNQVVGP
jgi:hypothetical protein